MEINLEEYISLVEEVGHTEETIIEKYRRQMAENHTKKIDDNFWLVVKQKPKWMPSFLYRAVIKELIEFQQHNFIN